MKDITYLVMSDNHLGSKRNTTKEMVDKLDIFFDHYTSKSQFTSVDMIILAGDLYDSLLDYSNGDVYIITLFLGRLMGFCSRHDIKLRILKGTPSHDWDQPKNSETVYKLIDKPFDFKYIDTLHIEYIKDFDLYMLYVPDEWTASTELTLSQVKELMYAQNIKQVDIAIMHGAFLHQMPPAARNAPVHDAATYLSIVKHFISIGHIHTHSVFERIIAQGSFDRVAHGEEEPKGAVLCRISEKDGNSFSFIENKGAKIFKTIILKSKNLDNSLIQVEKVLAKIPENSYVRIKATKDHPLYVAFDDLKLKFPMYFFTKTNLEDEEDQNTIVNNAITLDQVYCPVTINRENIVSLIMTEVNSKYSLEPKKIELLNQLLIQNNV